MTTLKFYKYQGAGNDFIIIDNRNLPFKSHNVGLVSQLCNRKFGIGADGLMLLQDADTSDFEMLYYNADGKPGSMCGNGGRCIVSFAQKLGIITANASFMATDGLHYASINEQGDWVSLKMLDVEIVEEIDGDYVLNTGSPHYVRKTENLERFDVFTNGKAIRNSKAFVRSGINVNFFQAESEGYFVRTYERGVEGETLACGTGAIAVALAVAKENKQRGELVTPIRVLGGHLVIRFHAEEDKFTNIFLQGPAIFVFEGTISL